MSKDTQKKEKENTRGESESKVVNTLFLPLPNYLKLLNTFTQMFGMQPTIATFKDILNQLNDINHFLSVKENDFPFQHFYFLGILDYQEQVES